MRLKNITILILLCNTAFAQTNKNQIENKVFLGLELNKDGTYSFNSCEKEHPVLKFENNTFYYYYPIEGTHYNITELKKNNNESFEITTNSYYFLKGEQPIEEQDKWFLIKKDNSFWEFKRKSTDEKLIFIDSLDLKNSKIKYKKCKETNNNIVAKWHGSFNKSISRNKRSKDSRDTETINLVVKRDSVTLNVDRYMGSYSLSLNAYEKKGRLYLTFDSVLDDEESVFTGDKENFGYIIIENGRYFWYCPYINKHYNLTEVRFAIKKE
ncbi:MAG: hypothetical protein J0L86_03730 [Flavobacteriales bacterium]|nr:hypothetical protein [Flavobacteriales bacterium]